MFDLERLDFLDWISGLAGFRVLTAFRIWVGFGFVVLGFTLCLGFVESLGELGV